MLIIILNINSKKLHSYITFIHLIENFTLLYTDYIHDTFSVIGFTSSDRSLIFSSKSESCYLEYPAKKFCLYFFSSQYITNRIAIVFLSVSHSLGESPSQPSKRTKQGVLSPRAFSRMIFFLLHRLQSESLNPYLLVQFPCDSFSRSSLLPHCIFSSSSSSYILWLSIFYFPLRV